MAANMLSDAGVSPLDELYAELTRPASPKCQLDYPFSRQLDHPFSRQLFIVGAEMLAAHGQPTELTLRGILASIAQFADSEKFDHTQGFLDEHPRNLVKFIRGPAAALAGSPLGMLYAELTRPASPKYRLDYPFSRQLFIVGAEMLAAHGQPTELTWCGILGGIAQFADPEKFVHTQGFLDDHPRNLVKFKRGPAAALAGSPLGMLNEYCENRRDDGGKWPRMTSDDAQQLFRLGTKALSDPAARAAIACEAALHYASTPYAIDHPAWLTGDRTHMHVRYIAHKIDRLLNLIQDVDYLTPSAILYLNELARSGHDVALEEVSLVVC